MSNVFYFLQYFYCTFLLFLFFIHFSSKILRVIHMFWNILNVNTTVAAKYKFNHKISHNKVIMIASAALNTNQEKNIIELNWLLSTSALSAQKIASSNQSKITATYLTNSSGIWSLKNTHKIIQNVSHENIQIILCNV